VLWLLAGLSLAASSAAAVFAPACFMFILAGFGALTALGALLNSEARAFFRVMIFISGVAVCAAGLVYSRAFKQSGISKSDYARFVPEIAKIREFLNEDRYADALKSFGAWNNQIYSSTGNFSSDGTERAFKEAEDAFSQWIGAHYPGVGPQEYRMMQRLLAEYSFKTPSGALRFANLRTQGVRVFLKAFVEGDETNRADCIAKANELIVKAYGILPKTTNMELELWSVSPHGAEKCWGTYQCNWEGLAESDCADRTP
jgi:hypothetical protein